jgi:putative membrane protein
LLLGLLLGAVIGLWPFQEPVPPAPGQTIKGRLVTSDNRGSFDQEDWPTARFSPSGAQLAAAAGLVAVGFAVTVGIARLGGREHEL